MFTLLQPQARGELHKVPVDASDDARDGRRAGYAARAGMRDIDADEDGGLLGEPAESVARKLVVDPTELGVDFESDVGQILVLLALVERFFEEQALRADAEFHRAEPLDARVDKVVLLLQQDEDEADVPRLAERLDRPRDVLERAAPPRVVPDRRQLVRGEDRRRVVPDVHPAVLALVVERLDKVDQTPVLRALEAQRLHAVAHDEDLPVPHPAADVELDVEDVPAPVLHARHAPAVRHARRGQLAAGDDDHLAGDADAERVEHRRGWVIAQALHRALHDDRRVVGRPATRDPEHLRGFLWAQLAKVGLAGFYIAQFCGDVARSAWAAHVDDGQVVPMLQSNVVFYNPKSETLAHNRTETVTHF